MKRYIVVAMLGLVLFPSAVYAKCCDCCKNNYIIYTPLRHPFLAGTTIKYGHELTGVGTVSVYPNSVKKYTGIEKLVGKMLYRTTPLDADGSFMGSPCKLLAVTEKYLILTSDTSYNGLHELERATWDDGNWEEVVKKLWTVTEITLSNKFPLTLGLADKYCVRCGGRLQYILGNNNYYCGSCKTGFNSKEE